MKHCLTAQLLQPATLSGHYDTASTYANKYKEVAFFAKKENKKADKKCTLTY